METSKRFSLAESLRSAIAGGELPPGTRLKEQALAEEYGASRPTVREALGTLASEGLLTQIPNVGVLVKELSADEILDAMRVRHTLDMLAATRIIEDASNGRLNRVEEGLVTYCKAMTSLDESDRLQAHLAFHREIWAASDSEVLLQHWPLTASHISLAIAIESRAHNDRTHDVASHELLVAKLRERNLDEIRQAFYDHTVIAATKMLDGI